MKESFNQVKVAVAASTFKAQAASGRALSHTPPSAFISSLSFLSYDLLCSSLHASLVLALGYFVPPFYVSFISRMAFPCLLVHVSFLCYFSMHSFLSVSVTCHRCTRAIRRKTRREQEGLFWSLFYSFFLFFFSVFSCLWVLWRTITFLVRGLRTVLHLRGWWERRGTIERSATHTYLLHYLHDNVFMKLTHLKFYHHVK